MNKGCYRIRAEIDLDILRANFRALKSNLKPDMKACAVIKADAYGHGAAEAAKALKDDADMFAVATPEEALNLRKAGVGKPVLLLGLAGKERYEELIHNYIRIPAASYGELTEIAKASERVCVPAFVHVKIDTGMGRIGFPLGEETVRELMEAQKLPLFFEGIFTHLATADARDPSAAHAQVRTFMSLVSDLRARGFQFPVVHYANSAASILFDTSDSDMVRLGVSMYGLLPSEDADFSRVPVKPVMRLVSEACFVKTVPAGTPIGYGGTFTAARESRILTLACGYADGYPRTLSNRADVLIRGVRCPVAGRVCMDQMMVDITDHPEKDDIRAGEEVVLLGKSGQERITAEELGNLSGRFNYELVCDISKRVPRVFFEDGFEVSERDWFGL